MNKRVLRYVIGIDDTEHEIPAGKVVMFGRGNANRTPGFEHRIDVWVENLTPENWLMGPVHELPAMTVQVFGTGQPIPPAFEWLATCIDGHLVWHLYRTDPTT